MVIRRGEVTDIVWVLWGFVVVGNELPYNLSMQNLLIICHHHVATKCFGKPQTKFGAL